MGRRFRYRGPGGHGLGQQFTTDPLHTRPAQPVENTEGIRAVASSLGLTSEQEDLMDQVLTRSMADLDLLDGTEAELAETDAERDVHILAWTDIHGTPRRTSVTTEILDWLFSEINEGG